MKKPGSWSTIESARRADRPGPGPGPGTGTGTGAEIAARRRPVVPSAIRLLVWLCVPVLLAGPAAAQKAPETVAQTIERQETAYSQTFVTGDRAAAERLLAADFTGVNSQGRPYDRATILAAIAKTPHQVSARIDTFTVRVHGGVAIALGTETDTGPGKDDIEHRIWLDTWLRGVDGWKLIASSEMTPAQK